MVRKHYSTEYRRNYKLQNWEMVTAWEKKASLKYRQKNLETLREKDRERYWNNHAAELARKKKYHSADAYKFIKETSIVLVSKGKMECVNCGCNDKRILEIHHINGDGSKEKFKGIQFRENIIKGVRSIDDLELRCKLCNNLHYIESLYGKLPFQINWIKDSETNSAS